ncbi:MAG: hypothetical protein HKN03_15035, partial [Acidimicrobiales bacterium]|nr:hypothetical protein [Acidimicrobiales bacterium]
MKEQSENGPADLNSVPGAARAATSQDLSAVMELILDQQAKADRNIASLGIDRAGLTAELEDLEPPWFETLRVLRSDNGAIAGAILADWSVEARRAWIHGP